MREPPARRPVETEHIDAPARKRSKRPTRLCRPGAAATLYVHPNTVVYRLGRIKALTGYDPRNAHHLVAFLLALRTRTDYDVSRH